jgi:hypothetical protein
MKKFILTSLLVLTSILSFSQNFINKNGLIIRETDTVAKIENYDNNIKIALAFKSDLNVNVKLIDVLSDEDIKKMESDIFNTNCEITYTGNLVGKNEIETVIKDTSISSTIMRLESYNMNLQNRLSISSDYLIKSANQRNTSIIIGVIGSIISTGLMVNSLNQGYTPLQRPIGLIIGVGTTAAVLTLNISSNNNQRKAGVSLKLK